MPRGRTRKDRQPRPGQPKTKQLCGQALQCRTRQRVSFFALLVCKCPSLFPFLVLLLLAPLRSPRCLLASEFENACVDDLLCCCVRPRLTPAAHPHYTCTQATTSPDKQRLTWTLSRPHSERSWRSRYLEERGGEEASRWTDHHPPLLDADPMHSSPYVFTGKQGPRRRAGQSVRRQH